MKFCTRHENKKEQVQQGDDESLSERSWWQGGVDLTDILKMEFTGFRRQFDREGEIEELKVMPQVLI